jgi:DNA-binding MarR family transcriptional regulator
VAKSIDAQPQSRAWGLFLMAHTVLLERIETALSAAQLPPLAWYDVLWELEKAEDGRLRMHELADRIVMPRYNLTRLADRIEQAGLIQREDCADDRRGYFLTITPAGMQTRKTMWKIYGPQIDALFTCHLSDTTAITWSQALTQMIRGAREPSMSASATESEKKSLAARGKKTTARVALRSRK